MVLAEGTTNLMQRLARLPTAPYLGPLLRREPVPSALPHQHHLGKKMISIRWCCIDRLSWHHFMDSSTDNRANGTVSASSCNLRGAFLGSTMMYEFVWLMKICLKKYVGSRQSVSVAL